MTSWVASAHVSFTVDAPALTALGQPFRVAFAVDAEPEKGSFKAPEFEDFDVLAGPSVSTGHSVQFINGKQSSSYNCTYTFVLMPRESGTFTIGSASIVVDGKSYTTKPQLVEVIDEKPGASGTGKTTSAPESRVAKDDIFIRFKLSSTDLYKGESLRASLVEMRDSIAELAENVEPESSSTDTQLATATESEPAPKKKRTPRRKLIGEEGVVETPLFPFYEQRLF
jgi:hypothetical protein